MVDSPAPTTQDRFVSTRGTGRVAVVPDVAEIRLGIAVVRPTAAAAQADAAATMQAILAALRAVGIEDANLRTSGLSLQPSFDHSQPGPARLAGYELRNAVVAKLRRLDRVSEAVDAAIAAGATTLDGLSFDVADRTAAEATAREAAVADALAKAATLAAAAGVELGEVVSIVEGYAGGQAPAPRAAGLFLAEASTPVEGGTTDVAVTVTLTVALR